MGTYREHFRWEHLGNLAGGFDMRAIWNRASEGETGNWLKDVAALCSLGAFLWVALTWISIAEVMVG